MTMRAFQDRAWAIKLAKGFDTSDVPLNFCLLSGEVAEAFDAWRKAKPDFAAELADIAIFLLGIARMTGVDLDDAIDAKLTEVEGRTYRALPNGAHIREETAS